MNSIVPNIISAIRAPEISPKVNTVFFIDSFLLTEKFSQRREDSRNRFGLSSYFWVNLPREAANHTFVSSPRAVATGTFSISHFPFTIGHLQDSFVVAPCPTKCK